MTDPSVQPVAAPSAFARARAWLATLRDRLSTWWADPHKEWPVEWLVIAAALLVVASMLATCSDRPDLQQKPIAEQPVVMQAALLAPLMQRIQALDDQVAELRYQVAKLQEAQSTATPPPDARRASGASQNRLPSQAQESKRWGTTDLDREIEAFTRSLNQPEQAK
ncbi:hypothetical protein [Hydrogenophaga taeniospiralis]|uniref:hypothetical protein n=1 Tax=Hydrogenophaga taeniospiralis TaxID=65656 RepID=UPI001CF96053|nr:hypothetical protein [Hydrogenophaga taeniospiralis]UCU92694.1 hypothetical protein KI616_17920 [Hydrogenophaga taeniospiralis]